MAGENMECEERSCYPSEDAGESDVCPEGEVLRCSSYSSKYS